jgi:hypothetical protein
VCHKNVHDSKIPQNSGARQKKVGAQHTLTTKDKKKNDMKEAEWSRR